MSVVAARASEWVLLETAIEARTGGLAQGSIRLWSEDGHLLGLGAQTMRVWDAARHR